MENTTETDQNSRELTATEIKIVTAQIEDRLTRLAKAEKEYMKRYYEASRDELEVYSIYLKKKYDIPREVFFFAETAIRLNEIPEVMAYIKAWVLGQLSKESFNHLFIFFEEEGECDYGWVLQETPMGFYNTEYEADYDEILDEIRSVGTRARKKNNSLKPLHNWPL